MSFTVQLHGGKKITGEELGTAARIPVINEFLERQIGYFTDYVTGLPSMTTDEKPLDMLFREMLGEVWNVRNRYLTVCRLL